MKPSFTTPRGTTHVALISSQPFPIPISHSALCVLNHGSINQRIENLLCTHKLHTPDLAHLTLKPFALLICYLVGTRNHQAQLLIPLKGQHSQGPDDRSQAFIAQGQSFRTTEADLYRRCPGGTHPRETVATVEMMAATAVSAKEQSRESARPGQEHQSGRLLKFDQQL